MTLAKMPRLARFHTSSRLSNGNNEYFTDIIRMSDLQRQNPWYQKTFGEFDAKNTNNGSAHICYLRSRL